MITLEQTVDIPASREVHFSAALPKTAPSGSGKSKERTSADEERSVDGLLALRGTCEGENTLEAYFERKWADKLIEIEHEKHISGWEG